MSRILSIAFLLSLLSQLPAKPAQACGTCPGDVDASSHVDEFDVPFFIDALLAEFPDICADVNGDFVVNGLDIEFFIALVFANGGAGTACQMGEPCTCDPDGNNDGQYSNADLPGFGACVGNPTPPGCGKFDIDCDGDVDFADQTSLQSCFIPFSQSGFTKEECQDFCCP